MLNGFKRSSFKITLGILSVLLSTPALAKNEVPKFPEVKKIVSPSLPIANVAPALPVLSAPTNPNLSLPLTVPKEEVEVAIDNACVKPLIRNQSEECQDALEDCGNDIGTCLDEKGCEILILPGRTEVRCPEAVQIVVDGCATISKEAIRGACRSPLSAGLISPALERVPERLNPGTSPGAGGDQDPPRSEDPPGDPNPTQGTLPFSPPVINGSEKVGNFSNPLFAQKGLNGGLGCTLNPRLGGSSPIEMWLSLLMSLGLFGVLRFQKIKPN